MSCRKAQGERPTLECYDSVHSVPLDHTPGPGPFAASPHRWVPVHTQPASCSWPQTWRHRLVTPCPTTPRSHRSPHRSPDQGQNTRLGSQHLYPPSCLSGGQLLRVCCRMPPDGSWELSSVTSLGGKHFYSVSHFASRTGRFCCLFLSTKISLFFMC